MPHPIRGSSSPALAKVRAKRAQRKSPTAIAKSASKRDLPLRCCALRRISSPDIYGSVRFLLPDVFRDLANPTRVDPLQIGYDDPAVARLSFARVHYTSRLNRPIPSRKISVAV